MVVFFFPPLCFSLLLFSPRAESRDGAGSQHSQCSSAVPKSALHQTLQSVSFTTNFASCFLIKFAASFKYQSMNHPRFLQTPLKMWNQTNKRNDTQRNVTEEALPGACMATAGAREENWGKTRKTWPQRIFSELKLQQQHPTCSLELQEKR